MMKRMGQAASTLGLIPIIDAYLLKDHRYMTPCLCTSASSPVKSGIKAVPLS